MKGSQMSKNELPKLGAERLRHVISTLTRPRLSKYLRATHNHELQALQLYVLNTRVSAALLADIHYVEVALRNKFDAQLAAVFGAMWFSDPTFLALIDPRSQSILQKAQNDATKHWPKGQAVPPGKVIAELTFGFWHKLTDSALEHRLWVPYLHKAFSPRKAPKRSAFNQQLEKLRQLRNRVAHHEPIFHLDLLREHKALSEIAELLCPTTALLMAATSTVRREVMSIGSYRRRRGI